MVAKSMGPSQAPVCEAFIMTGETILKTYTNKSENGSVKKTIRAADTTTPCLNPKTTTTTNHNLNGTIDLRAPCNSITTATATATATATTTKTGTTEATSASSNFKDPVADYIKHAQYRVAAAIEQRAKSQSLNELTSQACASTKQSHPAAATGGVTLQDPARRLQGTAGGPGTNRRQPSGEQETSARVQQRAPEFLHEQQHQHKRQQQEQELERQRRTPLQEQPKAQQRRSLDNDVGRQNSEKSTKPPDGLEMNPETKKPKDCEHSTGKKVDILCPKEQGPNQMDKQPTPVTRTATFIVTPRRNAAKQDPSKLNGGQRFDAEDFSIQFKTGFLNRKRIFEPKGRATSKGQRGWRRVYVILRDLRFIVRYGQQEKELEMAELQKSQEGERDAAVQKMEEQSAKTRKQLAAKDLKNTIRLHHSFAKRSTTYTKREYVFHLVLADRSELLLQAASENEMNSWIDTINFASACLSSPPLPSAVSNTSKRNYHQGIRSRPILPASYTKLSYWEQLTDHEERLERLKAELEEHLAEAPMKRNANKRSKSDFIDKIAYLREKIEHYTVYLDLMQKKSNSPEAIVLSKHPQIASLTPSKEMVQSLPLNATTHESGPGLKHNPKQTTQ